MSRDGRSNQGMLVQAKRLDDDDRNYKWLYKKTRLKGESQPKLQLVRLIESAKRYRLPPGAMSLSLLKFVGQASLVDDAMLPS